MIAETIIIGISTNLLSEVIVRGAEAWLEGKTERERGELSSSLSKILSDTLIASIRSHQDEQMQELLARCLCDDVFLCQFAADFMRGEFRSKECVTLIQERLGDPDQWKILQAPVTQAVESLLGVFEARLAKDGDFFRRFCVQAQLSNAKRQGEQGDQLARIEKATLENSRALAQILSAQGSARTDSQTPSSLTVEGQFPPDTLSKFLQKNFELARSELENGSAARAKEQFQALVQTLEEGGIPGNEVLYFRCRSNLGVAAFYLNDIESAAEHLAKAFPYSNNSLKGRTNLALAQALRGDRDIALQTLEQVLEEEPTFFAARLQKVDLLFHMGRVSEAAAESQKLEATDPKDRLRIAQILINLRVHDRAAEIAEAVLAENPKNPDACSTLGDALGFPILESINQQKIPSKLIGLAEQKILVRAVGLHEKALPEVRRSDRTDWIARNLANLSAMAAAAGMPEKAMAYAAEAIEVGGARRDALCNQYNAAMVAENFETALSAARQLSQWEDVATALMLEVETLMSDHRFDEGLARLDEVRAAHPELNERPEVRNLEVRLTFDRPDVEGAKRLVQRLIDDFPDSPLTWVTAADIARSEQDLPRESECLTLAVAKTQKRGLAMQCRARLAQIYAEQFRFQEALDQFMADTPNWAESPYRVDGLVCLYNLKRLSEALELADEILAEDYNHTACDVAIQCCLAGHHLGDAIRFAELMRRKENSVESWSYLAHLNARIGNRTESKKLLLRAIQKHPDDYRLFSLLGAVSVTLGEYVEAIDYAIKALAVASPEQCLLAHRGLVGAAFAVPPEVTVPQDRVAKVHESIAFLIGENDHSLRAMEFDESLSELKAALREQMESANEGSRMFSQNGLPIYYFARMAGRDIYDVWKGLTRGGVLSVRMAIGTEEEQSSERSIVAKSDAILVEGTALLTLALLGELEILTKSFQRVVVAYPTLETLKALLDDLTFRNRPSGVIGLADDGEHLVLNENVESFYAEKHRCLTNILDFVNSDAVEKAGFFEPATVNTAGDFIRRCDASVFAAIYTAKELSLPILCDDVGTRQIATMAAGLESFCTQRMLEVAAARGSIEARTHHHAVLRLFENNYTFVSENPAIMTHLFRENGWTIDGLAQRIIERFDTGQLEYCGASRILGALMAEGWLRASNTEDWLVYFCRRLGSSGSVESNFRWAAIGCVQVFLDAPELLFALARRLLSLEWLAQEGRQSFQQACELAAMALSSDAHRNAMSSSCPARWGRVLSSHRVAELTLRRIRRSRPS